MRRVGITWDRFTDFHLFVGFALSLCVAGTLVLTLLDLAGDARPAVRATGWALLAGALALACWAVGERRAERRRRAKLDRAVDSELSDKWAGGFARAVGAYEKPWYLLCGETGVGKTAALRAADLPRALGPDGQPVSDADQGLNGTFMFDWWFFENAVVLDSAGDLLENPDQRWVSFLERVREGRPIQPINGVILAIAAADLAGDRKALRRKAAMLARQVVVAREQLRVRFPLYLLVTKSDLITGFSDYFSPSATNISTTQILGWSNPQDPRFDNRPARAEDVREGLETMIEELRARRSSLLGRNPSGRKDAPRRIDRLDEMFAFPDAITGFLNGIEEFVEELLTHAGTFAPPFFRGVYFTSAMRTRATSTGEPRLADDDETARQQETLDSNDSPKALFLGDLMLEKVIPEAGMVTPLEDVVSGVRRRGRTLAAAAVIAAMAICGVTFLGYLQTAGRVRPHSQFWGSLADWAKANPLSDLAMFDPAGQYRGGIKAGPAGRTVIDFHTRSEALADERASTWLLPLTGRMEEHRRAAHQQIYQNLLLLPSLVPAPGASLRSSGSMPPAPLVDAVLRVTGAGSTPIVPDLVKPANELLKLRLSTEAGHEQERLEPAQVQQVADLLDRGARHASDGTVEVRSDQRQSLAGVVEEWLRRGLETRRVQLIAWKTTTAKYLATARDLINKEDEFLAACVADPDLDALAARLQEISNAPLAKLEGRPAGASLGKAVADQLQVPPVLLALRARVRETGSAATQPGELAEIATATDAYEAALVATARDLAKAADTTLPGGAAGLAELRQVLSDRLDELDRAHLGGGEPLVLQRRSSLVGLSTALGELTSNDKLAARFAAASSQYPHPFFRISAVLGSLHTTIQKERDQLQAMRAPDPFNKLCVQALDRAMFEGESRAWEVALGDPELVWKTAASADAAATVITESPSDSLVRTVMAPPEMQVEHLRAWLRVLTDAEGDFDKSSLRDRVALKVRLNGVAARLDQFATAYFARWQEVIGKVRSPNIGRWADLSRIGSGRCAEIQDWLNKSLEKPREALDLLAAQDRFPELKKAAAASEATLNDRALPPNAPAICEFLKTCDAKSALTTRDSLLRDRHAIEELLPQAALRGVAGTSTVQDFWQGLMSASVDALIADIRPAALEHMRNISNRAHDRFPLCARGESNWESSDLGPLDADLDALRPARVQGMTNAMARRIRDLDVVNVDWSAYIDWLRTLETFLAEKEPWSLEIRKAKDRGTWQAAYLQQPSTEKPGSDQLYLGGGRPLIFAIDGGAELRGGLAISLLNRLKRDGGTEAAIFQEGNLAAPWSVLRLAAAHADQPFELAIVDKARTSEARSVLITLHSDAQAILREMPERVPELPH